MFVGIFGEEWNFCIGYEILGFYCISLVLRLSYLCNFEFLFGFFEV